MFENLERAQKALQPAMDWLFSQPVPVQLIAAAAALAVLWVLWILLRVILVALRATFRGL